MDYKHTYVKITGKQHFNEVVKCYAAVGVLNIDPEVKYEWVERSNGTVGADNYSGRHLLYNMKYEQGGRTELILRNGKLVPKNEPANVRRRTRITYTEYPDGSSEITKIENCLTAEECQKIAPGYLDGVPHYYLDGDSIVLKSRFDFRFRLNSRVLHDNKEQDAKMDSEFWPDVMRRAGERFTAWKKTAEAAKKGESVEVII